ncbi:MAG TPA: type II toxin-antitoxin system prevent-host-death family antitoxin [Vicinamibacterales bacterium]|nr:type II toxin-antitoxin system prevent-host-death family antitoxin [Vicinamibacterales bacterium]
MKRVSMKDLKAHLSSVVADAEAGRTVIITRHNTPVAQVGPATDSHVHRGRRSGAGRIAAAIRKRTKGRYLAVLLEDRGDR